MYHGESVVNNPLGWWKQDCVKYPSVANLPRSVLSMSASSAPSEHSATRIHSLCHARLKEEVAVHMMLIKENLKLPRKHYCQFAKNEKEENLQYLEDLDLKLMPLPEQNGYFKL